MKGPELSQAPLAQAGLAAQLRWSSLALARLQLEAPAVIATRSEPAEVLLAAGRTSLRSLDH
jgi:hypothetical protein